MDLLIILVLAFVTPVKAKVVDTNDLTKPPVLSNYIKTGKAEYIVNP